MGWDTDVAADLRVVGAIRGKLGSGERLASSALRHILGLNTIADQNGIFY